MPEMQNDKSCSAVA